MGLNLNPSLLPSCFYFVLDGLHIIKGFHSLYSFMLTKSLIIVELITLPFHCQWLSILAFITLRSHIFLLAKFKAYVFDQPDIIEVHGKAWCIPTHLTTISCLKLRHDDGVKVIHASLDSHMYLHEKPPICEGISALFKFYGNLLCVVVCDWESFWRYCEPVSAKAYVLHVVVQHVELERYK